MKCPNCDGKIVVVKTVTVGEVVHRLRKCAERTDCGWLLSTVESPSEDQYLIYRIHNDQRNARSKAARKAP